MIARLELEAHGRRALHALAWLGVALPLAVAGVVALALLVVALLLAVTIVGLPALIAAEAAARLVLRGHRRAANRLLGAQILPPAGPTESAGGPWRHRGGQPNDRDRAQHDRPRPAGPRHRGVGLPRLGSHG